MKDNMVQELLLKALAAKTPGAASAQANNNRCNSTPLNNMLGKRETLENLLKSLYLNNAPNAKASNIKNVNNLQGATIEQNQNKIPDKTHMPFVFEQFLAQEPDFFKEREALFEYLNSADTNFDIQELIKIAQLAKQIEQEAIKRFCAANPKYAKFLSDENTKFLNRLENNMHTGIEGVLKSQPYFNEQDVSKMSTDEFLANEKAIDAQIMNLIKNS